MSSFVDRVAIEALSGCTAGWKASKRLRLVGDVVDYGHGGAA